MEPMMARTYRADIDGLRAVAIVLVVLFHATSRCPGGFVGVDVFFTISGFLITGLLLHEQSRKEFRLADFWVRRVRRLFPAATVMVVATLVAGFFVMLPDDYADLARSAIAQQLLVSNVHFMGKSGYFDGSADLMPLLHTWSLAVEEQFYIGYPLLLLLLGRLPRRMMVAVLLVLAGISFGVSDWGVRTHQQATFYLLPTRAWEILIGGLICFAPIPRHRSAWVANLLAGLGLSGILLPAWLLNAATPFPGRAALLPCLATAMVIYANSLTTTWVGRLLQMRPVVFVGLVSYSLYLWHWPILSFLQYLRCDEPSSALLRSGAVAISFILAVVTWRYVELPFRSKDVLPQSKGLLFAAGAAMAVVLASALAIVAFRGLPRRFDPQALSFAAAAHDDNSYRRTVRLESLQRGKLPTFGNVDGAVTCLVWGDSHAMSLIPGIDAACKTRGVRGFQVTNHSTAPLLDFVARERLGLNELAPSFNRAVVDHAVTEHIDVVFIIGYWVSYADRPGFEAALRKTVHELAVAGTHVVLVRDVARFPYDPNMKLSVAVQLGRDVAKVGVPDADYRRINKRWNDLFDQMAGDNVSVLDLAPVFVDETGLWRAEQGGVSTFCDHDHLTTAGSLRAQPLFEDFFDGVPARR
jgi:peptidoglycan/LPS O-acetylase OafA/YrhL